MRAIMNNTLILTKSSRPFEFNGKTGISYKADIMVDNSVAKISISEELFNSLEVKHSYALVLDIYLGFKSTSVKAVSIVTK